MSSARDVVERLRKRRAVSEIQTTEGTIYVRGLSGKERVEYFQLMTQVNEDGNVAGKVMLGDQSLVALALCDKDGAAIFDNQEEAFAVVKDWAHDDVVAAVLKVIELSGFTAKAQEDAEKK